MGIGRRVARVAPHPLLPRAPSRTPLALHPTVIAFHLGVLTLAITAYVSALAFVAPELAFLLAITPVVALVTLAERHLAAAEPAAPPEDRGADLAFALLTPIAPALVATGAAALAIRLASVTGALWPVHAPWALQALAAFVLGDFAAYWAHRFVHANGALYRFHEIHHSVRALYWLNALRFHPVDTLFFQLCTTAPVMLLGAPPSVIAFAGVVGQTATFLQHTRVPVKGGALLHTSLAHRLHHREGAFAVRNFGGTTLLWDRLFGTHEAPTDARPRLGPGRALPRAWLPLLFGPLSPRSRTDGHRSKRSHT